MEFATTEDLGIAPKNLWRMTKRGQDIVVTSNGRPIAILTGVDETTYEKELEVIKRARALRALDMIHKESIEKGIHIISEEEIQVEIEAARKEKCA